MANVKGFSQRAIGRNIRTEQAAGRPRRQATAIALNTARRAAAKSDSPAAEKARRRLRGRGVAGLAAKR